MRRNLFFLVATVVIVLGALVGTLVSNKTPVLGLDLRGGVSVVLAPVGKYKSGALDVAVDVIRNRVDSLGVAEPDVNTQGNDIVVDLPGVKDRAKAERLVGQTAELRFRPVLLSGLPPETSASSSSTTTTKPSSTTTSSSTTTTTPATTTTIASADAAAKAAIASCDANAVAALPSIPTTARADDKRSACVVLAGKGKGAQRYYLGPTALTGKAVSSATSQFDSSQGWGVHVNLTSTGSSQWDTLGAEQFHKQVAIVLDSTVYSAPTIQPGQSSFSSFQGTAVISGGSINQSTASDLAKLINYGALPVQLKRLTVENVSPTLGSDQLNAGIAAGVVGLVLVALYMLLFYRLLGLVVIVGLGLSGAALYALIAWLLPVVLGIQIVLTLAGVTGIIVSVGVTVDSYVVYFERLKDEVRAGRTVRSSVDRAFVRSFRTIVAADLVSLLGALVLYLVAIGSVRGFALYLLISTILDLLVAYFFMHPVVSFLARRAELVRMRGVGIGAGLDAREAVA